MFVTILISVCTIMHLYVFWRTAGISYIEQNISRKAFVRTGLILWFIFFLGCVLGHDGTGILVRTLEFLGMNWMGILFLIFIPLFLTDLVTLFGFFLPRLSAHLRGLALLVGVTMSAIALLQGLRPPVVGKYEVSLSGLPDALDGTVIVALSDMHLGSQLGRSWVSARIDQVKAQQPDLVVLLGDIFEGHGDRSEGQLVTALQHLSAPYGIWAVAGNHESYGRSKIHLFEAAGFKLLNNEWAVIKPGLILAGVEDLTAMRRKGESSDPISQALSSRPPGATIFLSHTPWLSEKVAKAGVGLMLSGHTHGGQIWPFDCLVRTRYPFLEGQYEVGDMTVIISRGTGTWGPRMRLWHPGEILKVTLRVQTNRALSSHTEPT